MLIHSEWFKVRAKTHDELAAIEFKNNELRKQLDEMSDAMDRLEEDNSELESSVQANTIHNINIIQNVKIT